MAVVDLGRYFMTIPEAVQLVIQAGAIGADGEALVLDMGSPVRIADVAAQLIKLEGRPTDFRSSGLRPGEKLHEELFGAGEQDECRVHPLISHVRVPSLSSEVLDQVRSATGFAAFPTSDDDDAPERAPSPRPVELSGVTR